MRRNMADLDLGGEPEINLSPMIDCIFILLIFFIVTTVFVQEAGIDVEKPEASNSTPPVSYTHLRPHETREDRG